jgi:hypothetical protein
MVRLDLMQEAFEFSLHKISNGVLCYLLSLLSAGLQMVFQQNTNYTTKMRKITI